MLYLWPATPNPQLFSLWTVPRLLSGFSVASNSNFPQTHLVTHSLFQNLAWLAIHSVFFLTETFPRLGVQGWGMSMAKGKLWLLGLSHNIRTQDEYIWVGNDIMQRWKADGRSTPYPLRGGGDNMFANPWDLQLSAVPFHSQLWSNFLTPTYIFCFLQSNPGTTSICHSSDEPYPSGSVKLFCDIRWIFLWCKTLLFAEISMPLAKFASYVGSAAPVRFLSTRDNLLSWIRVSWPEFFFFFF